jgi:hypothetical protein
MSSMIDGGVNIVSTEKGAKISQSLTGRPRSKAYRDLRKPCPTCDAPFHPSALPAHLRRCGRQVCKIADCISTDPGCSGYCVRHYRVNINLMEYGLTLETYLAMYDAQDGRCKVCEKPCAPKGTEGRSPSVDVIQVDHNHVTGKVRGLLCFGCNASLGQAKDDIDILRALVRYLEDSDG